MGKRWLVLLLTDLGHMRMKQMPLPGPEGQPYRSSLHDAPLSVMPPPRGTLRGTAQLPGLKLEGRRGQRLPSALIQRDSCHPGRARFMLSSLYSIAEKARLVSPDLCDGAAFGAHAPAHLNNLTRQQIRKTIKGCCFCQYENIGAPIILR